jgi:hypothetical protein
MMTPSQKGAIAEAAIAAAAIKLGVRVLRPLDEGGRYDLVFDVGGTLLKVQCKWAPRKAGVIVVNTRTSRLTPRGYVRGTYTAAEVDAIAAYCPDTDRCYLLAIEDVLNQQVVHLRLVAAANHQEVAIKYAAKYEFGGAVAQLGERRAGSAKVRGSSPLSSISNVDRTSDPVSLGRRS